MMLKPITYNNTKIVQSLDFVFSAPLRKSVSQPMVVGYHRSVPKKNTSRDEPTVKDILGQNIFVREGSSSRALRESDIYEKVSITDAIKVWRSVFMIMNERGEMVWKPEIFAPEGRSPEAIMALKKRALSNLFLFIKKFPRDSKTYASSDALLRGKVDEAHYLSTWSSLYEVCGDRAEYRQLLINDIFCVSGPSSEFKEDHPLYYLVSGGWLSSMKVWRDMLGNPLQGGNIATSPDKETEIIVRTFYAALTRPQLDRIFRSREKFGGYFVLAWLKKEWTLGEVMEVWGALYDYFIPHSAPRTVLLELARVRKKESLLKRWLDDKIGVWLKQWFSRRPDTPWEVRESTAALKLLSYAVTGAEARRIFRLDKYGYDFHVARENWRFHPLEEDEICRAFLSRYPLYTDWVRDQLCVIFPHRKERDYNHVAYVEAIVLRNIK